MAEEEEEEGEVASVGEDKTKEDADPPEGDEEEASASVDCREGRWKSMESLEFYPRGVDAGDAGSRRFLSFRRRRKRKPPTNWSTLVDDLYHGSTRLLLENINDWSFNAFALDRATGGRCLPMICFNLFHSYNLMNHFSMDPVRVWKFFTLIEEGYHSNNPYHNAIHAADVTQAMHCFLQEQKLKSHVTPLEILASLVAAVAHDLDHPGVNQPFLVATSNHLASLYKNASVLENHHWRSAMACLIESGMTATLDDADRRQLHFQIQSLILATDIARHQEFITALRDHLDGGTLDVSDCSVRHLVLQMALKCADIGNPCRPWEVSQAWSIQVTQEFYRQGDLERCLRLPVTVSCDRFKSSLSKIQSGFFRYLAAPLFQQWHRFQDTRLSSQMMDHLLHNQHKWDAMLQSEEQQQQQQPEEPDPDSAERLLDPDSTRPGCRRHSMPYGKLRSIVRRDSLPLILADSLGNSHVTSEVSILSMTSWNPPHPKAKRRVLKTPAVVHTSGSSEDKENVDVKRNSSKCKKRTSNSTAVRQGSLRLKRRGSLPQELEDSNSFKSPDWLPLVCPKLYSRRGSAPGQLLVSSHWTQLRSETRDWSRERTNHQLRRRRSGGPELFASALKRAAQPPHQKFPPLPHSSTRSNAKAKLTTSPAPLPFASSDWPISQPSNWSSSEALPLTTRPDAAPDQPLSQRYPRRGSLPVGEIGCVSSLEEDR